jgi:hypothetical protein
MPPFGMDGPPPDFFMTDDERGGVAPMANVEQPVQLTSEILLGTRDCPYSNQLWGLSGNLGR